MPDAPSEAAVSIERSRVLDACDLIFGIASGKPPAELLLDTSRPDDFARLEALLNAFAEEFNEAKVHARRLEQERIELIGRQQLTITLLSTPIIDVWEGVLALPIVGAIDARRAQEMTIELLGRIHGERARCVIVDVTGVAEIDSQTAEHLARMIDAAEMLGAYCVLTGIQPSVAQTLVELNIEITVPTRRTLRDGLRACFQVLRR